MRENGIIVVVDECLYHPSTNAINLISVGDGDEKYTTNTTSSYPLPSESEGFIMPYKPFPKKCLNCQGEFLAQEPSQRFCGRSCANAFRKNSSGVDISKRFWSKVKIGLPSECWEWQGSRNEDGYGRVRVKGANRHAHRIAYELSVGEIYDGLYVCHRCDNPPCVNPNHLFLGNHTANMRDMYAKDRHPRIGNRYAAKLTLSQVLEIRELLELGISQSQIALRFSVSQTTVSTISRKKSWWAI